MEYFVCVAAFTVVVACLVLIVLRSALRLRNDLSSSVNHQEEKELAHHVAVLRVCIQELEQRVEQAGTSEFKWQSKLKVARLMERKMSHQIDSGWMKELSEDERLRLLADHPLL